MVDDAAGRFRSANADQRSPLRALERRRAGAAPDLRHGGPGLAIVLNLAADPIGRAGNRRLDARPASTFH